MIKKITTIALALTLAASALAADDLHREHRSIWMSPFLGANWPSSAITTGNSASLQRALSQRLDKFKDDGVNVLYYHVRSFCDAAYRSSYEPWSRQVAPGRGVEPAFDPFEYLIEQAHARGIEVYGWVNPYRYCNGTSGYGEGELNYENSHPDWLLKSQNEIILNPCLPEVIERICLVVEEIVKNYDVDGIIFDDYFYSSGSTLAIDADHYKQYQQSGGTMGQLDWRRDNVNRMVEAVNRTIKAAKPWVAFGISPAGTASPTTVETEYGMPPGPYGDWQYAGIASDPLHWLKHQTIDFISPQLYWPERWKALVNWWGMAAEKFGRHFYPSTDLSDFSEWKTQTFIDQIDYARTHQIENQSGYVFFQYGTYVNGSSENLLGTRKSLGENLAATAFVRRALTPLRFWDTDSRHPAVVSNLAFNGTELTWDAVEGARYAVYAIPAEVADKRMHPDYLIGVSYNPAYTVPADKADCTLAVAVYDRFGNEYAAVTPGATPTVDAVPVLQSPLAGAAPALFDFRWQGSSDAYVLEVSESADFSTLVARIETRRTAVNSSAVPLLQGDRTYYWRVTGFGLNRTEAMSATGSFALSTLAITSPAKGKTEVSLTPTIEWTPAEEGTTYTLELSREHNFKNGVLSYTTTEPKLLVPEKQLISGRTYYARVTAVRDESAVVSETSQFTTVDINDYPAPTFVNPLSDGETLYSNSTIEVAPWSGMYSCTVQIAENDAFAARSSYTGTLSDFRTATPELSSIKVGSKALQDGKTYYVRARGTYYLSSSSSAQYTDYSAPISFVYSAEAGVNAVEADGADLSIDAAAVLHTPEQAQVYNLAGQLVAVGTEGTSLAWLPAGAYLVRTPSAQLKWLK